MPVKVFILTKQSPRAPPEGFIWDRLINNTLEIYYSSPSVYEGHQHSLIEDAYHALIENRLLQDPLNKLTPEQAHKKAVAATRGMFHKRAFHLGQAGVECSKSPVRKTPQDSGKDEGQRKVVVTSRGYKKIPGTDRTMLAETEPGFESYYEAFRGQVDQIYGELGERRWIMNAQDDIRKVINILEENKFKLSQEQTRQIETILTGILTAIVKPLGKLKVEEKQAAQDNLTKVLAGIRAGGIFLTGVDKLLSSINAIFEIRRKTIESMTRGIVQGRLSKIHVKINKRNMDIIERLDQVEMFRQGYFIRGMKKLLLGLRALIVIRGEPDLSGWHGYLSSALDALAKKQDDKFVEELKSARKLIKNSTVLYHLWSLYVNELIKEEMRSAKPVNRAGILKKVFLGYFREEQLSRGLPNEEARQRALWWARLYQAIFIPFKIKGTRSGKRIPNPVFKAATFYQDILKRYTLEKIIGWRLMRASTKVNTVNYLRQIQAARPKSTHLIREDLQGLMTAIAKDFKLNDEQGELLKGCVLFEPREKSLEKSPGLAPAMLPGVASKTVEFVKKRWLVLSVSGLIVGGLIGIKLGWMITGLLLGFKTPVGLAISIIIIKAAWEEYLRHYKGLGDEAFLSGHREEDQGELTPFVTRTSKLNNTFLQSTFKHIWKNFKWFFMNKGTPAMLRRGIPLVYSQKQRDGTNASGMVEEDHPITSYSQYRAMKEALDRGDKLMAQCFELMCSALVKLEGSLKMTIDMTDLQDPEFGYVVAYRKDGQRVDRLNSNQWMWILGSFGFERETVQFLWELKNKHDDQANEELGIMAQIQYIDQVINQKFDKRLAGAIRNIRIHVFLQTLYLKLGYWTNGWIGYNWEKFIEKHPVYSRDYVNRFRHELDFSYNPQLSFWASYWFHLQHNLDWLLKGVGEPLMTVSKDSDKSSFRSKFGFKRDLKPATFLTTPFLISLPKFVLPVELPSERSNLFIILLLLLLLLLFLLLMLFIKPGGVGFIPAAVPFVIVPPKASIQPVRLVPLAKFKKVWGHKFFNRAPMEIKIQESTGFLKQIGPFFTINAVAPAVPLLNIYPCFPLGFGWVFFGWGFPVWRFIRWLTFGILTVFITVFKVIIKVRGRQIVLYIADVLEGGLSKIFHTMLLTIYTFEIDFMTTVYQYSMIV